MKHRKRRGPNPLHEYRRLQQEVRAVFDPFTTRHCPTCTTPCCIKPSRVTPVDVGIALGCGHRFTNLDDPYGPAMEYAGYRLTATAVALPMATPDLKSPSMLTKSDTSGGQITDATSTQADCCDYLVAGRCSFPNDLRPFGCTMFVCGPMHDNLPADEIRRIRRLLKLLDEAHTEIVRMIGDQPESDAIDRSRQKSEMPG
jgi:hypothetical protein